jgi:ABC-type cobalt transport system substrate-binding protein
MVVIDDRHFHAASVRGADEELEKSSQRTPDTLRPWVAPAWERQDTPMEITMYAGQR